MNVFLIALWSQEAGLKLSLINIGLLEKYINEISVNSKRNINQFKANMTGLANEVDFQLIRSA